MTKKAKTKDKDKGKPELTTELYRPPEWPGVEIPYWLYHHLKAQESRSRKYVAVDPSFQAAGQISQKGSHQMHEDYVHRNPQSEIAKNIRLIKPAIQLVQSLSAVGSVRHSKDFLLTEPVPEDFPEGARWGIRFGEQWEDYDPFRRTLRFDLTGESVKPDSFQSFLDWFDKTQADAWDDFEIENKIVRAPTEQNYLAYFCSFFMSNAKESAEALELERDAFEEVVRVAHNAFEAGMVYGRIEHAKEREKAAKFPSGRARKKESLTTEKASKDTQSLLRKANRLIKAMARKVIEDEISKGVIERENLTPPNLWTLSDEFEANGDKVNFIHEGKREQLSKRQLTDICRDLRVEKS